MDKPVRQLQAPRRGAARPARERALTSSRDGHPATALRLVAYEGFRRHLLDATLKPGDFVSQRKLASLIGVSLGAVREAIPRLEAEGLVQTVPQRGLQVAAVDLKLVRNAFQLRAILEREAALRFAETVTDDELDALERAHRAIIARAGGRVTRALLADAQAVDWGLHDRIIDALGNDIVREIYRVNTLRIRLIRLERVVLDAEALLPAMREHLAIIAALRTREPGAVAAALDDHLASARERALAL